MDRRTALQMLGAGLLGGIAGCTGGDATDPTTTPTDTSPAPTTSPTTTPSGDQPGGGGTSTTDDGSNNIGGDPTTDTGTPTGTPVGPGLGRLENGGFESDLDGWTVDYQLPDDPNKTTGKVDHGTSVVPRQNADGHAFRVTIDGSQDDGTVWVQQPADLAGVSSLAVDYLCNESFNVITQAAVYAGPDPGRQLRERDFDRSEDLQRQTGGWQTFTYPVDHDGQGLVAVGVNIVWETESMGVLDNVRLLE